MPSTRAALPELDHLVVACATLEQADRWLRERTGVASVAGGSHPGWGTHNRVLRIGARTYLELIAVDPSQAQPAIPRPFGLDDPTVRARIALRPRLVHFVCRVPALDAPEAPGERIEAMTRGAWTWRIAMPVDAASAVHRWSDAQRLRPTRIAWPGGARPERHPADALAASGVSLLALRLVVPDPGAIERGLPDDRRIVVARGALPALGAELQTPNGWRLID